jgi:cystathionine beta-lyase/cystathionine gamma-synthase
MNVTPHRFATRCAHAGARRSGGGENEPVQPPVVQSAIFDLGSSADADAIFSGARKGYAYSRFGNPTVDGLARALADLEGGAEALVTSSGNAALALEAALVLRGLRTFALRMHAHNRNGEALARWLSGRPEIARAHYPTLPSHPQAELVARQMRHGGGLLSFELAGGETAAVRFFDRLKLIIHAVSLGGPETLVTRPAKSSHRGMTAEARQQAGISDGLIRLAAGIEDSADLIRDLEQAIIQET